MRIAILSNVTADVLADLLRPAHDVWLAPGYGGWMQMALDPPRELKAFAPDAVLLLLDATHADCDVAEVETAVVALERALPLTTVLVPDLDDLAASTDSFYDERMWKLASMPWSLRGLEAIRDETDRLLGLMRNGRKKVLALDFDNTIWQGTIGEDGLSGIRPDTAFQRALGDLRRRGVLLVGLSRNNAADVAPVWNDPRMALGPGDFAALRIDWRDKCENLSAVAEELALGTDSFVFLDDNPVERAQMAARLPDVSVPEWPISARHLARLYFPRMRLTQEDLAKTEQYRAESNRRRARTRAQSLDDYLRDLEIRYEIHAIADSEFARVAQLSQKANQFNVRTNRYTPTDVANFASDPSRLVMTLHARDRFGDQGLVAFVHVALEKTPSDRPSAEIVDWVMSCRAMNRRLEFALESRLEDTLKKRGVARLAAIWRRTAKNAPVRDLFEAFGFTRTSESEGEKRYERDLV